MNPQIQAEIRNAFKIQPGSAERIPNPTPVVEVGNKLVKNILTKGTICSNATSVTIITTPANQDFYLVGGCLSLIKDVTSTSLSSSISFYSGGSQVQLLAICGLTLTVQNDVVSIYLNHPILVDPSTNITVNNSTNVANVKSQGLIYYYLDETNG